MIKPIILCVFFSLAFALFESSSHQGIFPKEFETTLKESSLGRAILMLTQLKSKAQQFDFSRLYNALDELEKSFRNRVTEENDSFNQDNVQYETDKAFFTNQVTQFTNEVALHENDLTELTHSRERLTVVLDGKRNELADAQKLQSGAQAHLKELEKTFNAQNSEYNEAITALDSALELLSQVREGALVQLDERERIVAFLQSKMKSLTHRRVMYSPLIKALVQVVEPSFADSEMVTKVIRLLQDLRQSLNGSRVSLVSSFESEKQENEKLLAEHTARVNNLTNIVIPTIQDEIETKTGEIGTKKSLLADSNSNLKAASANLEALENKWRERCNQNSKLIDGYNTQLAILATATQHLEAAGIRR